MVLLSFKRRTPEESSLRLYSFLISSVSFVVCFLKLCHNIWTHQWSL